MFDIDGSLWLTIGAGEALRYSAGTSRALEADITQVAEQGMSGHRGTPRRPPDGVPDTDHEPSVGRTAEQRFFSLSGHDPPGSHQVSGRWAGTFSTLAVVPVQELPSEGAVDDQTIDQAAAYCGEH